MYLMCKAVHRFVEWKGVWIIEMVKVVKRCPFMQKATLIQIAREIRVALL